MEKSGKHGKEWKRMNKHGKVWESMQKHKKEWESMDPEDRTDNFLPRGYDSMRKVPAYDNFVKETLILILSPVRIIRSTPAHNVPLNK